MDGLDGYVARKFNETSKLGAVLDIMGDRIAEYSSGIVVSAYIPKGSVYALNEYGEYVSNSIILNKIENA